MSFSITSSHAVRHLRIASDGQTQVSRCCFNNLSTTKVFDAFGATAPYVTIGLTIYLELVPQMGGI